MSGDFGEAQVGVRVLLRELRQLLVVALAIPVKAEGGTVLEDRNQRHLRVDVLEAVLAQQTELIIADQRVRLNEDVANAVLVMAETRDRQLARNHATAKPRVSLQDQDFFAGGCQVSGGDEAIVAGANGDNVVNRGHAWYLLFLSDRVNQRCDMPKGQAPIHG
ncbi:hypothetical protein FQZ97_738470 [compost metagenome]